MTRPLTNAKGALTLTKPGYNILRSDVHNGLLLSAKKRIEGLLVWLNDHYISPDSADYRKPI